MSTPSPASAASQTHPPAGRRLSVATLVVVSVCYGGCGSVLSSPMAHSLTRSLDCQSEWAGQGLCDFASTWALSSIVCLIVPTLVHRAMLPALGDNLTSRSLVGALSVVVAVVVSFGGWRMMLDVPLLWAGTEYLVFRYCWVLFLGVLLSPVGVVLGALLRCRWAPRASTG